MFNKIMALFCKEDCPVNLTIQEIANLTNYLADKGVIVLPAKVGTPIYYIEDECDFPDDCHQKMTCKSCEYHNCHIEKTRFHISILNDKGEMEGVYKYYLTREEAEAEMKKLL